jgi:hypothetical protein
MQLDLGTLEIPLDLGIAKIAGARHRIGYLSLWLRLFARSQFGPAWF